MADKKLQQLRKTFAGNVTPESRRPRSASRKRLTEEKRARRLLAIAKARRALRAIERLPKLDNDLRSMKDRLVEELWGIRHARTKGGAPLLQ